MTALLQAVGSNPVGDGALFLIVGGLFMLGLVVALIVLRSIFPTGKPSRGLQPDVLERQLLPTPSVPPGTAPTGPKPLHLNRIEEGRREAQRVKLTTLDDALDQIVQRGWGQPRILRYQDDRTLIRLHECSECRENATAGCAFQSGFLEGVMRRLEGAQAQVSEIACRAAGQPACEFEVRH